MGWAVGALLALLGVTATVDWLEMAMSSTGFPVEAEQARPRLAPPLLRLLLAVTMILITSSFLLLERKNSKQSGILSLTPFDPKLRNYKK